MNIQRKILIDRLVGKPAALALNMAARTLAVFLRRDHTLCPDIRRIAVAKFVGMGTIIQLTPLLRTLRANYPKARIVFVTLDVNRELVGRLGLTDDIISVNDSGMTALFATTLRALLRLWRFRAELYIDLEVFSNYSTLLCTMSCALNRIGYFKSTFSYRSGLYNYLVFYNMKARVSDVFLQIARLMGCGTIITELHRPEILDGDRSDLKVQLPFDVSEPYLVVNPNASDLRVERRWDGERFARLMERIAQAYPGIRIVVSGSRAETGYVAGVLSKVSEPIRRRITDLSGKLSLGALFALLDNMTLLISNDTGPVHIAFALKKKSVTLWGPCHPLQYGDFGSTISFFKNLYCSPCILEFEVPPCKGDNQCMKAIAVDEVFQAVRTLIDGRPSDAPSPGEMVYTRADRYPLGIIIK